MWAMWQQCVCFSLILTSMDDRAIERRKRLRNIALDLMKEEANASIEEHNAAAAELPLDADHEYQVLISNIW